MGVPILFVLEKTSDNLLAKKRTKKLPNPLNLLLAVFITTKDLKYNNFCVLKILLIGK